MLFTFQITSFSSGMLKIGVVALHYMANLTDFRPLGLGKVYIRFVVPQENLDFFDLIVLPGTKNAFLNLQYCHSVSFGRKFWEFVLGGGVVLGVCGGFQMLGEVLRDPGGVESREQEIRGFGFFPMETVLERDKLLCCVEGHSPVVEGGRITGYEIHHGKGVFSLPCDPFFVVFCEGKEFPEGAVREGRIFGTYLHGLFDEREFRRAFLNYARRIRGLPPRPLESVSWKEGVDKELGRLADSLLEHLNMELLGKILGLSIFRFARWPCSPIDHSGSRNRQ